jgi:hypothetical protein
MFCNFNLLISFIILVKSLACIIGSAIEGFVALPTLFKSLIIFVKSVASIFLPTGDIDDVIKVFDIPLRRSSSCIAVTIGDQSPALIITPS